jgi:hypothetical protein
MYDLNIKALDETLLNVFTNYIFMNKDLVKKIVLTKIFTETEFYCIGLLQIDELVRRIQLNKKIHQY